MREEQDPDYIDKKLEDTAILTEKLVKWIGTQEEEDTRVIVMSLVDAAMALSLAAAPSALDAIDMVIQLVSMNVGAVNRRMSREAKNKAPDFLPEEFMGDS